MALVRSAGVSIPCWILTDLTHTTGAGLSQAPAHRSGRGWGLGRAEGRGRFTQVWVWQRGCGYYKSWVDTGLLFLTSTPQEVLEYVASCLHGEITSWYAEEIVGGIRCQPIDRVSQLILWLCYLLFASLAP